MKKILLLILPLLLTSCWSTSNGEKIGTIVKLADEGTFIKTHEGQLIRGGMNNGSGSFGAPFDFTIEDSQTYQIAKDAMEKSEEVKIHYHRELVTLWRTETEDNIFVDSIEVIK